MPLALPPISYPPELPVSAAREEIARAIRDHQVVVVAGATGSGKTTQLPKILLELGRERIGHTQPRRIAARSIAERVAEELGVELGTLVGYQVRFDDRSSQQTAVKLMTDGVLLAEINRDHDLLRYDTIVIDEAHERSLTIDFLLGYLTRLLPRRPDLKVVITSATIDPERFARHFADADGEPAPIVEVSGRTYPVEIRYRPLVAPSKTKEDLDDTPGDDDDTPGGTADLLSFAEDRDTTQGILDALGELAREEPGDVLVFLSGENEIRDAEEAIRGRSDTGTEVLPLYGRLSAADQHRVFGPRPTGVRRRVVLATNVAETSLTVPGIRYVIDTGLARISRYSTRAKVQRLPIEPISQASANQRSGRAGRTSPGIAIRLYSEDDYMRRSEYTDPEILRTNLAAVVLQMISLGLGEIAEFPFLQPPDPRGVKDGVDLLLELGALARDRTTGVPRLTRVGRDLSALPVDPRFGRMLVEARRQGVVREVTAIVAALSVQDPRERPLERREQADAAHARFADPSSDFVSLLNLWNHLEERQRELSGSAFRRLCRAEFLNYLRVREWQDLVRQLTRAGKPLGIVPKERTGDAGADADAIHRSLLAGLLSRIGLRDERVKPGARGPREYVGARGQRFAIFPGSALARKAPPAVMAAELVETSRLFARTVAAIDPAWAEPLAGDLVTRSYGSPRWEKRQGSAVADERVTLYGVPIVPKRRVQLARVDPEQARELLIRHALVGGDWPHEVGRDRLYDFTRENARVRRELEALEERTRRRDILVDDEAVVAFYEARLPADVTDVRRFETWWRAERENRPGLLTLTRDDLVADGERPDEEAYPAHWLQGEQRLRLVYRFEPGAEDDGVTVEVPLALLPRLEPRGFDWLVPGLREELVTALLKSLPKAIRREVVPAADWARRLIPELPVRSDAPIAAELARAIRTATHAVVDPADVDWDRVPAHLRMGFAAVDARGRRLAVSKDLSALQARFAERAREEVAAVVGAATAKADRPTRSGARPDTPAAPPRAIERSGLTTWDLDALPREVETRHGASVVRGFPALVDEGASVAIRVLATSAEQAREHPRGVRRLLALAVPNPMPYVQEHLTQAERLQLATSPYRSVTALLDDALLAVIDATAGADAPVDRAGFEALRTRISAGLVDALFETVALVARVLGAAREADRAISGASALHLMAPLADARAQLDALVHPGFVRLTGVARLRRYPVYLAGLVHRVQRLADNVGRDRQWQSEVEQAVALYTEAGGELPLAPGTPPGLAEVRWMLEELRLSLFAQHLGAAGPVSVQRVRKALATLGS